MSGFENRAEKHFWCWPLAGVWVCNYCYPEGREFLLLVFRRH